MAHPSALEMAIVFTLRYHISQTIITDSIRVISHLREIIPSDEGNNNVSAAKILVSSLSPFRTTASRK